MPLACPAYGFRNLQALTLVELAPALGWHTIRNGETLGNLRREAENAKNAVSAFHTFHSGKTFYAGQPGIEPWLRDTLVSLQNTLNTMAATQLQIAEQVDRNTETLRQVVSHLNQRQN